MGKAQVIGANLIFLAQGKSKMAARIKQIRAAGEKPVVRIIAAGLSADQALLVEAAFIWKSGRELVNAVSGHYKDKFRPKDTLHKKIAGFDFSHSIHFFNVGEGKCRSWDDCYAHGFLSTCRNSKKKDKNRAHDLHEGDVVLAYISQHGYVGVGRVIKEAVPARDFRVKSKRLKDLSLHASDMCHDLDDDVYCEYVTKVYWVVKKKRGDALPRKSGLFIPPSTRVKMTDQTTLDYIEDKWDVNFHKILEDESR